MKIAGTYAIDLVKITIPAEAGIQLINLFYWIPTFVGMEPLFSNE
jgi:hypothetical protein